MKPPEEGDQTVPSLQTIRHWLVFKGLGFCFEGGVPIQGLQLSNLDRSARNTAVD